MKNSFNILEIIITQILGCCMSPRMTIKYNVNENANEIINKKLDIILLSKIIYKNEKNFEK